MGINKKLLSIGGSGGIDGAANFNTVLYQGNGGNQNITGVGFAPDFVWIKKRNATKQNVLQDTVRGIGSSGGANILYSDSSEAEATNADTNYFKSFDTNGFTLGGDDYYNGNNQTYVGWNWRAPDSFSHSATGGLLASSGRSNQAAGFSIVKHTGSGSNTTVKHNLLKAPELMIYKQYRDVGGSGKNWVVYAKPLTNQKNILLNTSSAAGTDQDSWNNTDPTNTVFSLGPGSNSYGSQTNVSGKLNIVYCFHSVDGYSKIGSYTWSQSSNTAGVMVNDLGFTPRFVAIKRTNGGGNWQIYDSLRGSGTQRYALYWDVDDPESTSGYQGIKFDSNGFSAAQGVDGNITGSAGLNEQNGQYLYFATA